MTPEEAHQAIAAALEAVRAEEGAVGDDLGRLEFARLDALAPLRALSDEELDRHVLPLARSARPEERALVADVLRHARGRHDDWGARSERYATTLLDLAAREDEPLVLAAIVAAFLDLADPRGVELALAHETHPDPGLRHAVACVLGAYAHADARAALALVALSTDHDDDVRDWATFGLAETLRRSTQAIDADVVREALFARVDDPHEECRGEAWVGLAIARDPRAIPLIRDALAGHRRCWLALEAIEEWPRREYVEALRHPTERWSESRVRAAREACEHADE